MDSTTGILQNAQRLRYEALSNFATDLNKAVKYSEVSAALTAHLKYIINFFVFRFHHYDKDNSLCFEVSRGEGIVFKPRHDNLWKFENEILTNALPVSYTADIIARHELLASSSFNHPKIAVIHALPVFYFKEQKSIITIALKEQLSAIDIDFKFLKAISDLVANKLLQLELMRKVEKNNKELKAKNAQITKLNRNLEQTVSLRTAELTSINEELKTLFYRTSHDFRAPLANIMGLANLAKLVTNDAEALNLFEKCEEVARRLDAMLSKLNVLSMYSYDTQVSTINFKTLIEELKLKFASRLAEIGGRVVYDIALDDVHISNPHTYATMLENLLENSINYHNSGLIVQIYVFRYKDDLVIKFSDNGQGIPPRIINRIYDMYYRGHAESAGSGLGLYVVRKLVKSLLGDIFVQSKLKHHTHFIIKVPFDQSAIAAHFG